MKIAVAQQGSRMHYAVPRIFEQSADLFCLYTDICATKGFPSLLAHIPNQFLPGLLKRLKGRIPQGVPKNKIITYDFFGLRKGYYYSINSRFADYENLNVNLNENWCRKVVRDWIDGATHVYAFNSAGLEIFEHVKNKHVVTILEQTIAPKEYEKIVLDDALSRFPGTGSSIADTVGFHRACNRERNEWNLADIILCGSDFVKKSIGAVGGPVSKCLVVPYGVDFKSTVTQSNNTERVGKLRILFAGAIGLRKGAPILLEVAKRCSNVAEFRILGKIDCNEGLAEDLKGVATLPGIIPRAQMPEHYAWADIFFLPSFCEGSATVTYEAAQYGLPIICTENTGSMVIDGETGYIVPLYDIDKICDHIFKLSKNRLQVNTMSKATRLASFDQSEEAYGKRLIAALQLV